MNAANATNRSRIQRRIGTLSPIAATLLLALISSAVLAREGGQEEAGEGAWQVVQPNGLRWTDSVVGEGPEAVAGAEVTVHYEGWLRTGEKFDSSRDTERLFTFRLGSGRVIQGWEQGVVGMKVGGLRRLLVPSDLAYGKQGAGNGVIPANADLLFEIELFELELPKTQAELLELAPGMTGEIVEKKNGLAWVDLRLGAGDAVKRGRTVTVEYTGWLEDGTKFDSSRDRGRPFSFQVGARRVILGWDQGVVGMKIGGRRKLMIPAKLGYGRSGAGDDIPPNADLVFEVEVLRIE